jgi:hypothetical protein
MSQVYYLAAENLKAEENREGQSLHGNNAILVLTHSRQAQRSYQYERLHLTAVPISAAMATGARVCTARAYITPIARLAGHHITVENTSPRRRFKTFDEPAALEHI